MSKSGSPRTEERARFPKVHVRVMYYTDDEACRRVLLHAVSLLHSILHHITYFAAPNSCMALCAKIVTSTYVRLQSCQRNFCIMNFWNTLNTKERLKKIYIFAN